MLLNNEWVNNEIKEKIKSLLETYNPPKQNQEEAESLNRQIKNSEIEAVIKKLPSHKRLDGFTGEFYKTFKDKLTPYPSQNFPKNPRVKTPKLFL